MKQFTLIGAVTLICMTTVGTVPAYAYLDPGSGSMLLQLLLGGAAGVAMIAKMYWARVKQFFGGKAEPTSTSKDDNPNK